MASTQRGMHVDLNDPEMWDDSALQDSWNQALAEYKKYHSIHARGENIEDVIREAEEAEALLKGNGATLPQNSGKQQRSAAAGYDEAGRTELEDGEWGDEHELELEEQHEIEDGEIDDAPNNDTSGGANNHPSFPQVELPGAVLDATGADQTTKNMMMAWYYAGYYTGLHVGQQQAAQARTAKES